MLCKSVDEDGVTFYTNYDSAKGGELAAAPYASVTFPLVRAGPPGACARHGDQVSAAETAEYWARRPRGSQLGAWASEAVRPIASRAELLDQLKAVTERFAGGDVPVPPHWGGYRMAAETVEFWQGRENRVHNRIRITVTSSSDSSPDLSPDLSPDASPDCGPEPEFPPSRRYRPPGGAIPGDSDYVHGGRTVA